MDLVSKRYTSPFLLLDNLIYTEQINEWVEHLLNKVAEEKDNATMWEFFLHKVNDKSFVEWKNGLKGKSGEGDVMNEAEKEEIIKRSENILNGIPFEK